ncbi:MAG TPA: C45 family peptidase, partial [Gammaproteobacteria bacterium]|nr:C45 family peptidase [Gammaproteobacteria bacterium]
MMAKATRSEKNGWIMVHLEGSPYEIGYQHGYLLAAEIIDLRSAFETINQQATGKNAEFFREESYRLLWPGVPAEYRDEISGIAAGVNAKLGSDTIDIKDLVAMNSSLEMAGYYVPWLENQEKPRPPEHCSAFAATGSWTAGNKIVMAHNNWSEYAIGQRWNVILDIVPEQGHRMVMDALPGYIHSGDDFNINSAGLIVTETTISAFKGFDTTGVAEFVRARRSVQYASSIDEWAAIMIEGNNGGYANAWLIGDNKTGEIARLELGLNNHFLERTTDGVFTGANYPVNEKLLKEETTFDPTDKNTSANMRKLRWEELMRVHKGKIDVESAKLFMADHYDMNRKRENAGRFSLCGHMDLDSIGKNEISWEGAYFHAGAVQAKAT